MTGNNLLYELYENVFSLKFLFGVLRNIVTILILGIVLYIFREIYPITSEFLLLLILVSVGVLVYFCLPVLVKELSVSFPVISLLMTPRPRKTLFTEDYYRNALRIFKENPGNEMKLTDCLLNLANIYRSTGRFYDAEVYYKEALRIFKENPGTEIIQAECLLNLGKTFGKTGRVYEAEAYYNEAIRTLKSKPKTEIIQAECLLNLGNTYGNTGRYQEAIYYFQKFIEIAPPQDASRVKQVEAIIRRFKQKI